MEKEVRNVIKQNEWRKEYIATWMHEIIENVSAVLGDLLPSNGIFKYAIDVVILKGTALSRQSECFLTPSTDFHFSLKIKNQSQVMVLLNASVFRVATATD